MKKKELEFDYIVKKLKSSVGGGQSSDLEIAINPFRKQGTTQAVVSMELTKRFDIKDIEKANELYEKIQQFRFDLEKIVDGDKK